MNPNSKLFVGLAGACGVVIVTLGIAGAVSPRVLDPVAVPPALPGPTTTVAEAAGAGSPAATCPNVTASLRPTGAPGTTVAPNSYMADIRKRGRLRVGVDASKLLFSSVNPVSGQVEGFDIDIAREVARSLFGSPDAVEFVVIPSSERVDSLTGGHVDLVADTFTINCDRRTKIDFSSQYFTSGQRLLVRSDDRARSIKDMADRKVCAAAGSTSIDNIKALPPPRPEIVPVTEQADCLVLLQQGKVDGISTDDTILAGMKDQDPNVRIVGARFSSEPYGLGVPKGHPEWTRYVNGVLENVRRSGRWTQIYDRWLRDALGASPGPPPAAYAD